MSILSELQFEKLEKLKNFFQIQESVLVAFSGGVDSSLLLYLAHVSLQQRALGVIGISPSLPTFELREAELFAGKYKIKLYKINTHELDNTAYTKNALDRCYFCKSELYGVLSKYAIKQGYHTVIDGTNASELMGHRPGYQAVKECKVISPYIDHNVSKDDIRDIAKYLNLSCWDKPSFACLSSRFPTGTEITQERLDIIGECEFFLYKQGFKNFRVRYHLPVARIELDEAGLTKLFTNKSLRNKIDGFFKENGFLFVAVDIKEFKSGSLSAGYLKN